MNATDRPADVGGRTVERTIEIDAPVDVVWAALTDARELMNWFPEQARVEPGVGGSIWMSWNGHYESDSVIDRWEPGEHLRIRFPSGGEKALVTDYHLHSEGGHTVLRVVTSGFGPGSDWDDMYDGVTRGWRFELMGLKHYLERHGGTVRTVAKAIAKYSIPVAEAWARLTSPGGVLPIEGLEGLRAGSRYEITTRSGPPLAGEVRIVDAPKQLVLTVESLNDALMRLELETGSAWVFLSGYGVDAGEIARLEDDWRKRMASLLED